MIYLSHNAEQSSLQKSIIMKRSSAAVNLHQGAWMLAIALFAMSALGQAEEQPQIKRSASANSTYVFKPTAITPSPNGEDYNGRFLFLNKAGASVMVSGFEEPIEGGFVPRFVRYQTLENGVWRDIKIGYCATGHENFPMTSGVSYEFHVDLYPFEEGSVPLTGRIGFDVFAGDEVGWQEYWSYPFVLDWKKDRESGEFASARIEHYKELRAAFSKAGFKDGLLVGDDFCSRLLQSMMKESQGQEPANSFKPFVGKLDVTPGIGLDGKIRIDFDSDERREFDTEYTGWFSLDPQEFNPKWFSEAVKHHVEVGKWGDGIQMQLNDGSAFDSPLYVCIQFKPFDKSKVPTEKEAEALFRKMLSVLGRCLKE